MKVNKNYLNYNELQENNYYYINKTLQQIYTYKYDCELDNKVIYITLVQQGKK